MQEAANACHELLKCGCKKSCTNRCKRTSSGRCCAPVEGSLIDRFEPSHSMTAWIVQHCRCSVQRCSLSDTTLDTMVLHSSLLVAISAHLFMFIPVYRETFPSHPHLFLPRLRLPFTMPSVIIRCRLSCLLTCP